MADLVIVGALVFGAVAGWRKGFVLPLIALGGALLSIAALYAGPLNGIVPSGTAGLGLGAVALFLGGTILGRLGGVLVGLVYKVPALRRFDQIIGIPLGTVTAAVAVYVAVLGTLALDGWLSPLHGKATIDVQDVAELDQLLDTIESPILNLALTGRAVRFTTLGQAAREDYLKRWAASPLSLKRRAFQVMKRLVMLYTYGQDGSPYAALAGYVRPT